LGIAITQYATITGNTVSDAPTCIIADCAGSVIGNTIITNSGQIGISLPITVDKYILLDQNTVSGAGTHLSGSNGINVVKGINAGF
jgi:hypothetical protein